MNRTNGRGVALFLCGILLLSSPVLAETGLDDRAGELHALGLLTGRDDGLALDSTLTRQEAAVMIVRLMGKEAEAKATTPAHPFSDVDLWASPAVGWLYQNGLAQGVGGGLYGARNLCTAQMYCTFMLRLLGYSDRAGGDFSYADALAFAQRQGIADENLTQAPFTRRQMAGISFMTLFAGPDGADPLLSALAAGGVVDQKVAETLLERYARYREITALDSPLFPLLEEGVSATAIWRYRLDLGEGTLSWSQKTDFAVEGKTPRPTLALTRLEETEYFGIEQQQISLLYLADGKGWSGTELTALTDREYDEELARAYAWADTVFDLHIVRDAPFYLVDAASFSEGHYALSATGLAPRLLEKLWANAFSLKLEDWIIEVGKVTEQLGCDEAGNLQSLSLTFPVTLHSRDGNDHFVLTAEQEMVVLATGQAVSILLPDVFQD